MPARRVRAGFAIVRVRVGVGGIEAAGWANCAAEWVGTGVEADLRPRRAIEIGHELDGRAFDQGAYGQLDRLKPAVSGRNVEDIAIKEVKDAGGVFPTDDLFLIGDDIDHFERGGLDQPQVDADVHDIGLAREGRRQGRVAADLACSHVEATRADIVVYLGDAADDVSILSYLIKIVF